MIEVAGVVGEVGLENVEPAVAVVVGHGHAHAGLLVAIFAVGATRDDGNIGERSVVIVVEQDAGLRVHRHINIRPAIVIEIIGDRGNRIARAGLENAGFLRDIGKRSVAVVVIKNVGVAGQSARAAHHRDAFPLAVEASVGGRRFVGIEFDVVADEEIQVAVAVVVEPGAAGSPAIFSS